MTKVGRLAFRIEGKFWNCYLVRADTMENAMLMGSIRLSIVDGSARREQFMAMMKDALSEVIMGLTGKQAKFTQEIAAECERTKQ